VVANVRLCTDCEHRSRAGGGLKCNVDFMVVLCVVGLFLGLGIVVGGRWRLCAFHANPQPELTIVLDFGGEGGIRTHGTVTRTTVFETYSDVGPCRSA
jgi:hypothetical protein